MKESINPFYSTPSAILVGCLFIAAAILMHGGIIKVGKPTAAPTAPAAAQPLPAGGPQQAAKTEATIVNKSIVDSVAPSLVTPCKVELVSLNP